MRIEIWSDVVCPWCYIGKRRLESALSTFEHADQVEVVWRSYQLDPSAPAVATETSTQMLARTYGQSPEGVAGMQQQVSAAAAEEGLVYRLDQTLHVNTVDAHRLLHLALHEGGPELQGRLKEALLAAYFTQGRNVADHTVLAEVADQAGLEATGVAEVLASQRYADEVAADVAQARAYGATGVPFFVVDAAYGVSGAQPAEAFTQVLQRAWRDGHPSIEMVSTGDGDVCGPDGCPV
ncbi:DsbA family oxidoreductase [Nocardioides houyundeii]|uniref:DsbA family oxidoreductase n=1 Tax=Nocardioides houyundeii TaxID=2045452 RepID=UPI000C77068E|nr:DsbA family oxidoreductase [Nocardioides houyundeii]